jgi:hypothetical protein
VACDPYNFGFEKNPITILDQLLKSTQNLDLETFIEATDKEALCVYGNEKALQYLKENIQITTDEVNLTWKSKETYFKVPEYVGYWSYFTTRYLMVIKDKKSDQKLADVVMDCYYGSSEEKNASLLNLKPGRYPVKECKLVKFTPATFEGLPLPESCSSVKVDVVDSEFKATASFDSHE